jgi:hypothetical protein
VLQSNFFKSLVSSAVQESEEEQLRKRIDLLEATVALASISGGIAMIHMRKQNYVQGAYRMRKTWKYFEEAELMLLHPSMANLSDTARMSCHHSVTMVRCDMCWPIAHVYDRSV